MDVVFDREWLSGRARDAWARLVETDALAAADLKRELGERPTPARIREYMEATASARCEVWETVVAIVDELGDWELLEQVSLRYNASEGADPVRGLSWAAGAANQRGDAAATNTFLDQARAVDAKHPSLLLVEARLTEDPGERLKILDRVEPRDDRQRGTLEGVRAYAYFEAGDIDSAFCCSRSRQGCR
jgi:uncharacterized protein HemY